MWFDTEGLSWLLVGESGDFNAVGLTLDVGPDEARWDERRLEREVIVVVFVRFLVPLMSSDPASLPHVCVVRLVDGAGRLTSS